MLNAIRQILRVRMKKENLGATDKVILEEEEDRPQSTLSFAFKPQPVLSECHQKSAVTTVKKL